MTGSDLKAMARSRAAKFGHFVVEFATPGIGHILKSAGCDFVLFDIEHSGFHFETVKSALRYFEAADAAGHRARAVARIPPHRPRHGHGRRGPDAADGRRRRGGRAHRRVDEVSSRQGARRGAAASRMTATGRAGRPDKFAAANERTTFFCQIETAEGVENAEAIAAIDGVDCLWVGHFDLSVSLGIPGEFDHKDFTRRDRHDRSPPPASTTRRSAGWCRMSRPGIELYRRRASTSSAIRATSGCCRRR